jgi:ribosomal protein S18 acetylase RimI-like enzyme
VLDFLAVLPKFQRRGIATMLVKNGLEIADSNGIKSHVMSSVEGVHVYTRLGFDIVETSSVDYSQFGGTELHIHHFMVRKVPVDV